MGNVNYPKVTIIHGPEHGDIFKISDAFGLRPPLDIVSFTDTFPRHNPHNVGDGVLERFVQTDYLLLQSDLVDIGVETLAGAMAVVAQENYSGHIGYFDSSYVKVPEPWWTGNSIIALRSR